MSDKLRIPNPDDGGDGGETDEAPDQLDWAYMFDFRAAAGELEDDDRFVDVEWSTWDPVPDFTIATIEHGIGHEVADHITRFYRLTDGLELSWSFERDGQVVAGGAIDLFGFATVFDTWLDTLWPTDGDGADDEFLWSLRGFDAIGDPQLDTMTVMCVEEEYPTYDLFIHDLERRDSHLLAVDFRTYLECLLETRGTFGWQYLMLEEADVCFDERPEWRRRADRAREVVDELFPDADWPP